MPSTVNNRTVPIADDFKDTNLDAERDHINSLLTELANILDATEDSGNISAGSVTGTSLVQSGTGGAVTINGLLTCATAASASVQTTLSAATVGTTTIAGYMNVSVGGTSYEVPFYSKT